VSKKFHVPPVRKIARQFLGDLPDKEAAAMEALLIAAVRMECSKIRYDNLLNERISQWHDAPDTGHPASGVPLHEWLGMTKKDYEEWFNP
jgi:hypothetical protein